LTTLRIKVPFLIQEMKEGLGFDCGGPVVDMLKKRSAVSISSMMVPQLSPPEDSSTTSMSFIVVFENRLQAPLVVTMTQISTAK